MCIIILDTNPTLRDLLSFYDHFHDFNQFFEGILEYYQKNWQYLVESKNIRDSEITEIIHGLNHMLETLSPKNNEDLRRSGKYYTPKSLCRFINIRILKNTLKSSQLTQYSPVVLDPSSGLGFFLIDMYFLLIKIHLENNITPIPLKRILSNLWGFEINNITAKLSRLLLQSIYILTLLADEKQHDWERIRKLLNRNIKVEDFLTHSISITPTVIVGNPPYIRVHKLETQKNKYLRMRYFSARYDFDIYVCFFERCLEILPKGGVMGFITPEKYLLRKYAANLRLIFLLNSVILELIDVSRCADLFKAFTYPLITILKKSRDGKKTTIGDKNQIINTIQETNPSNQIKYAQTTSFTLKDQNEIHAIFDIASSSYETIEHKIFSNFEYIEFLKNENYRFTLLIDPIMEELEKGFKSLSKVGDMEPTVFCGTPRSKFYHLIKNNLRNESIIKESIKFIISKNIAPYSVFWNLPLIFDQRRYQNASYNTDNSIFSATTIRNFKYTPKLIIKANSRNITSAIDTHGSVFIGAYGLIWYSSSILNIPTLCAILNSNLINYYLIRKYKSYMVNSRYLSINSIILRDVPLPGRLNLKTGEFYSIIPESKFQSTIHKLNETYLHLNHLISSIQNTQNEEIIKKLKEELVKSQIYASETPQRSQIPEFADIRNLIAQLNTLIYDLYDIPDKIRSFLEEGV